MNKTIVLTLITLFICSIINAQDYSNAIRLNLFSATEIATVYAPKIKVEYERALSPAFSTQVEIGYFLPKDLTNITLPEFVTDELKYPYETFETIEFDNREVNVSEMDLNGTTFALAGKYYPGLSAVKGLFIQTKLAYGTFKTDPINGTDQFEYTYKGEISTNMFNYTVDIGTQFIIADIVAVNVSWFGIGMSNWTLEGGYTTTDPSRNYPQDKVDVDDYFNDLELPLSSKIEHTAVVGDNRLDIEVKKINVPIIRAINVSAGIVF